MDIPKIPLAQKPTYVKIGEDVDFFSLFTTIEKEFATCFLLESLGEQGGHSRYSIIGFDPLMEISAKGNEVTVGDKIYNVENPYKELQNIVPQHAIARLYAGGLVGFLSYDAVNYMEDIQVKVHPLFDSFRFGVYTDGIILDKVTGELFYFYYEKSRLTQIKKLLHKKTKMGKVSVKYLGDTLTKSEHKKAVEVVKEEIRAGNSFQAEVGLKSEFTITGDTLAIYRKLREVNPSPFMYYLKFGPTKIIGASPELMLSVRNGDLETVPLAGTIKRGKTPGEDQKLARELLSDPKEIAEHNMLVDLHRNDVGRVSQFGTVKVKSLMDILRFSHVQHIASTITGVLKDDMDMFDALAANFPMGTVTGAPKVESMKIIDRNETTGRGPYGGAVGSFGFSGDATFAMTIRSLFITGTYAYAQTSSGIVYDSEHEKEYDEVQRKLAAMKEVLEIQN